LERTEWNLWRDSGEARPMEGPDFPGLSNRRDGPLRSILDETGFQPCLQPWYIDVHRTLIAAPRSINQCPTSKITWQKFVDIVWDRFHPVRNVYVRVLHFNSIFNANAGATYTISTARQLLEVRPDPDANRRKSLLLIRWDTKNKDLSLLPTPTFLRILASLILVGTGPVRIDTLPPIETLDFILLPGGFCVIHEAGIVLFDDWQRHDLPVAELHTEIELLMDRYDYLEGGTGENSNALRIRVHELGQAIMGLNQGRYKKLSKEKLLMQINKIKFDVERTWLNTEGALRWRDFRAAVEKRWGLTGAKEEIYATLDRLESTLRTETEIRTGKLVSILTIYGFPIAIFAGFFSYTMEGWGLLQGADRFLNGNIHGIHIPGLLTFGGLSVATVLLMKLFFWLKK
ncbi:MAG: hypothetical protein KDK27_18710, partial [Leptospiraceae bacterium]|nr:hypothetical protein [Leptospiraceae bacterium]